jgi:hypothetical protein
MRFINKNVGFLGTLKPFKVIVTNLKLTKLGFIRKFLPKWFH